jgi:hypothetical protein
MSAALDELADLLQEDRATIADTLTYLLPNELTLLF